MRFFMALGLCLMGTLPSTQGQTQLSDRNSTSTQESPLDKSIDRGLAWLAKQQQPDGSWRSEEVLDPQTKKALPRLGPNGSTALALLAFFAQGYGPGTKTPTEKLMTRAQDFLVKAAKQPQPETASWVEPDGGQISHALALIAIISCYRDNKTEPLQTLCQQGLRCTEEMIDPKRSGWGLQPGDAPDLEVSYWQTEAIRYGAMSYFKIQPQTVKSVIQFLNELIPPEKAHTLTLPNLALYLEMRFHLGWKYDHQFIQQALPVMSKYQVLPRDPAANYHMGRMLVQLDKETRELWIKQMPAVSLAIQEENGSWPASEPPTFSRLGQNRLESTCLHLMTITLQNRFRGFLKDYRTFDESFPL